MTVDLVLHVPDEGLAEAQRARHAVDQGDHVIENDDCSWVSLNRLFSTTFGVGVA